VVLGVLRVLLGAASLVARLTLLWQLLFPVNTHERRVRREERERERKRREKRREEPTLLLL
jgi:uncharacterized membrane-anchored protein